MKQAQYHLCPIGIVESPLKSREAAPKQGSEGAPAAWLVVDPASIAGLDGLSIGTEIWVLTWLHQGRRDSLITRPRGDISRPFQGVFSTRSPDRPNPIGLHRVTIMEIEEAGRIKVHPLEAVEGTPILDIKPFLSGSEEEGGGGSSAV